MAATFEQEIPTQTEKTALAIFDNLFTEEPSFNYNLVETGKYLRQLESLVKARKNSLDAAKRVLKTVLARPDSELATLLKKREDALNAPTTESIIPQLPVEAQLVGDCLPRAMSNPKQDWFDSWDSSRLHDISPFLAGYIEYSRNYSPEGYVDFHISNALWALSTVAARRIYVPLSKPVYTPLAIALVARTSLFAKTSTAEAALNTLKAAGLGWLLGDDETTPQKLLADMSGHVPANYGDMEEVQREKVEQRMAMSGQVGWYYDEFNQLIDAMTRPGPMAEFAGLLRKLDNCPDEYKYSTRSHGQEIIKQPYLPLLANTTPANLRKHASKGGEFWNDGFWARFAFITPPPDAWYTKTMDIGEVAVPESLSKALREWNRRLGVPRCAIEEIKDDKDKGTGRYKAEREDLPTKAIHIEEQAYAAYKRYREALRGMIASNGNQDLDGSYVRLSDKALRIAALLASLENEGQINLQIWALAQEIAEMFRYNLHELYAQVSSLQENDPLEDILINHLKALNKEVTAREIFQYGPSNLRKLKTDGIRVLLVSLQRDGIIACHKEGKKEVYELCK